MKSLEIQRSKKYLVSTGIYDIPSDWSRTLLEEVIEDFQSGFASGERDPNGVTQLRMNNITLDGRLDLEVLLRVPRPPDIYKYYIKLHDILFNNTNSLDLIGKTAIVNKDLEYTFSNHITKIRVKKDKIIPYWLYLILLRYRERSVFKSICNTFVGQSGIGKDELKRLPVFFPCIHEQQQIASILSKVDNLIQKTDEIIEQTQRLKKGLIQRLLEKGIRHARFKEICLGPRFPKISIPESWHVQRLSDIARVIDSRHFTPEYTSQGMPLILPNNVKVEGLDLQDTKFTSEHDYLDLIAGDREPSIGDIVYSRNASFGVASRIETGARFSLGQDLVLIKPQKIDSFLLYLILNSRPILLQLARLNTGSTFQRINLDLIRSFLIPYPNDKSEQERISRIAQGVDYEIRTLKTYSQHLHFLKRGLMQKLLTGKIRVKA